MSVWANSKLTREAELEWIKQDAVRKVEAQIGRGYRPVEGAGHRQRAFMPLRHWAKAQGRGSDSIKIPATPWERCAGTMNYDFTGQTIPSACINQTPGFSHATRNMSTGK